MSPASELYRIGGTLVGGVAATSVGLGLYAFGQQWPLVVVAALVLGTGAGTVDAAIAEIIKIMSQLLLVSFPIIPIRAGTRKPGMKPATILERSDRT